MTIYFRKIVLVLLLLMTFNALAMPSTSVTLPHHKYKLTFEQPIRMDSLLTSINNKPELIGSSTFPLAFQLFDINREIEAQEFKQKILEQLLSIAVSGDKFNVSAQLLINQIKRWDIGYRLFPSLDWDLVRIKADHNLLLRGDYELMLPERNNHIAFEGLLVKPQLLTLSTELTLYEYAQQLALLSSAHTSFAWVIYPDGKTQRVGYAPWNEQPFNFTPNSVVFFGFNSDDPRLNELEQDIVKLITMRKAL